MTTDLEDRRRGLRLASRPLPGHGFEAPHVELERVAAWLRDQGLEGDVYGAGAALQAFEARVAARLGLAAARFLPSGTMAQQIALRLWSERAGTRCVGMHPTCHLELHEQRGYSRLHGLEATLIGPVERPLLAEDLARVPERLAAVVVELPTRENGGQLPSWEQLVELSEALRARGAHPHLDGARLWEAQAAYGRPFPEICALFDSVYVSFYKGIGALSGAMLLGPEDLVAEAAVWQRRHGGNLHSLVPFWASAAMRLEAQLARMPLYRERALALAEALRGVEGLRVNPSPPQVNLFHVWFDVAPEAYAQARDRVAEERGLWLSGGARAAEPSGCRIELYVGEAALRLEPDEVAGGFRRLVELARAE